MAANAQEIELLKAEVERWKQFHHSDVEVWQNVCLTLVKRAEAAEAKLASLQSSSGQPTEKP